MSGAQRCVSESGAYTVMFLVDGLVHDTSTRYEEAVIIMKRRGGCVLHIISYTARMLNMNCISAKTHKPAWRIKG